MAIPCIESTDCIALSGEPDGILRATPILDPSLCNGLTCTPTGLLVVQSQLIAEVGIDAAEADITTAGGETLIQAGSLTYVTPDCGMAVVLISIYWGTVHVTNLTAGGRIVLTDRDDFGAGFADSGFRVFIAPAAALGEDAVFGRSEVFVTTIAGGTGQTWDINRVAQVTSGAGAAHVAYSLGSIKVWMVQPA